MASSQDGEKILTAGWDGLIGLWTTTIPETDEVSLETIAPPERKKRRKVHEDSGLVRTKAPSAVLRSHTARVSAVKFSAGFSAGAAVGVSCGFDSTVRTWDVERGLCSHTIVSTPCHLMGLSSHTAECNLILANSPAFTSQTASERPFLALALPPTPESALAASADRSVTLFDLRSGTSTAAAVKFPHPATPATLVFAQSSGTQFASGSYDGVVRIWDIRSAAREVANARVWVGQKVLAISWAGEVMGVAGEGGVDVWRAGAGVEGGLQKETSSIS